MEVIGASVKKSITTTETVIKWKGSSKFSKTKHELAVWTDGFLFRIYSPICTFEWIHYVSPPCYTCPCDAFIGYVLKEKNNTQSLQSSIKSTRGKDYLFYALNRKSSD